MRQYSIDRVELAWNGLDFKEGMAKGSVIQETRNAESWGLKPTGQGKSVRVYDPDRTGAVAVQVDAESKLHQQLLAIAKADRLNRDQVDNGTLKDTSSGQTTVYQNMFIATDPDESKNTESSIFTWKFLFENIDHQSVEEPTNAVGN